MLILTYSLRDPSSTPEAFREMLLAEGGLQIADHARVIPAEYPADELVDRMLPLINEDEDVLFAAQLSEFAALSWANPLCGDAELGGLIRQQREKPPADAS